MDDLAGINIDKEPITVKHSDLSKVKYSKFRSNCPVCEVGFLLVQRDDDTFELLAGDNCILCGQRFIYSDIEQIGR